MTDTTDTDIEDRQDEAGEKYFLFHSDMRSYTLSTFNIKMKNTKRLMLITAVAGTIGGWMRQRKGKRDQLSD